VQTVDLDTGRDIALIILIVEAFVLILVPAALLFYAIRGMKALRQWLDPWIPIAQDKLASVAHTTHTVSETVVGPYINFASRWQRARTTVRALRPWVADFPSASAPGPDTGTHAERHGK
jgi:hypothetical protein